MLDFGGVISRTVFEMQPENEAALGLPAGSLSWRGPFEPAGDPLWRQMQDGIISERDYWFTRARETGELVGETWTSVPQFLQRIRGDNPQSAIRPEAIAAVAATKRGAGDWRSSPTNSTCSVAPDFARRYRCLPNAR
mgnify:CR=1 FL=1